MNIEINTETRTIIVKQSIKLDKFLKELEELDIPFDEYTLILDTITTWVQPWTWYDNGQVGLGDHSGQPLLQEPSTTCKQEENGK